MIINNLAVLMAERGYRINDVHNGTKISKTAITNLMENKSLGIQYDTLNKLCDFFSITPNELLLYTPNKWTFNFFYSDGKPILEELFFLKSFKRDDDSILEDKIIVTLDWNLTTIFGVVTIEKIIHKANSEIDFYLFVKFFIQENDEKKVIAKEQIENMNIFFLNVFKKEFTQELKKFLWEDYENSNCLLTAEKDKSRMLVITDSKCGLQALSFNSIIMFD